MGNFNVIFNGFDLSTVMRFTDIKRKIGNERGVKVYDAPLFGVNIQDVTIGAKIIEVHFTLNNDDLEDLKHKLAGVFSTKIPARLSFSDEPTKYYMAIVVNEVDIENLARWFQKGKIDFLIPDGIAHAVDEEVVAFSQGVAQNEIITEIKNDGTVDSYPTVKVTMPSDNNYIGIVSPNGVISLGNAERLDLTYVPMVSSYIRKFTANDTTKVGTSPTGDLAGGTFATASDGRVTLATKGPWDAKKWAGGYYVNAIADTNAGIGNLTFYSKFQLAFETGLMSQTGLIKVVYLDKNNNIIAMYEVHKASTVENKADFTMYYGGNMLRRYKSFSFVPSNGTGNPFRASTHGSIDFEKSGGDLRFFWFGKPYGIAVPELAEVAVAKVAVYIGQFGTRDLIPSHYVSILALKSMMAESVNRDVQNGVKTIFRAGDVLEVTSNPKSIKVNGQPRNDLYNDGSNFPTIPTGTSKLAIVGSSWLTQPLQAEVKYRKGWL
ncbi:hypothetical protein GKD59_21495 [Parabacteroides distasonis]|uniref:Siphovirus-type tail component RIFT-related domain-containing protein n=1 Tax=Parabacteroides distasonis TaxID=823 RepID=A0A7K0GP07_PARDI|nr:distal tail protein Dit [Parabacteroides distasonis]MRY60427.1 hypothetical protein [Parabacteroides distasonis]